MSSGSAKGKGLASGWGTNVADDPNPQPYPVLQVMYCLIIMNSFY